jgi:hypothetical protein
MDWFLMPWSVCVKSNPHPSIFVDDVAPLRQGKEEGTGNLLPLEMLKYLTKAKKKISGRTSAEFPMIIL